METTKMSSYIPTAEEPKNLDILGVGQHLVTIEIVRLETDKQDNPARDWKDENEVLYLYLTTKYGVYHHRLYWFGYDKYDGLIKDPRFKNEIQYYRRPAASTVRGYAIDIRTQHRVINEYNSKICRSLINQFCTAAGTAGQSFDSMIDKKLWIELTEEVAFGKKMLSILRIASEETGFKTGPRTGKIQSTEPTPIPEGLDEIHDII